MSVTKEHYEKLNQNSDNNKKLINNSTTNNENLNDSKKTNNGKSKNIQLTDGDGEWELRPPDGGWGWLVLFGSMLVNVLVPGTVKSFGVLFVEFLEAFQATPTAAAWIPALCYFLYSSLGPLSSILSVKYSYRTVTLLGGTFAAVGMMVTFWAQSVSFLYISYGILVGTGAGLSFPPTVYIVTSYFVRLRGLANGLCISGSAIGSIILPPVLRYLLETYGYRGSVLIMGGVTLNVWIAALFYDPVEKHMIKVPKSPELTPLTEVKEEKDEKIEKENVKSIEPPPSPSPVIVSKPKPDRMIRSSSSAVIQNQRKVSTVNNQVRSTPSLQGKGQARRQPNRSLDIYSQSRLTQSRLQKPPRRSPSTSSFQYISTPYHGSTLSALKPEDLASSVTLGSLSLNPVTNCFKKPEEDSSPKQKNKYFDLDLLKDPIYLVILISNCTNAISYTNFIILLPSYAITIGYDKSLAAYLISIVSALDLVGRIGGSALSDTELIPKCWYFVGGLAVSGAALTVLPFTETYTLLSVACAIFGLASGVYVGVTAVIMADMLGTERLTSSYGISLFVNGILQLIGPPLCGLWFQETGSYASLFSALGIVLVLGAGLWIFVPFIKRNNNKKKAEDPALLT